MRSTLSFGDPTLGTRGEHLPVALRKHEDALAELYDWLSNDASQVVLPDVLSINRGGTGGSTPAEVKANLGIGSIFSLNAIVDCNGYLRDAIEVIRVSNTSVTRQGENTIPVAFLKQSTGVYRLTGIDALPTTGWVFQFPKNADETLKVKADYTLSTGTLTLTVKNLSNTIVDIPTNTWIDIRLR